MSTTNKSKFPVITTGSKPATRSGTPTNGDLLQAITGMQASQSSQFRELQVSLASVTKQLADLKNDNLVLRNEVSSLAARIAIFEGDHIVPVNDDFSSKIIREISERNSCDLSVIAYDVPESSSSSPSQRIIDDTTELSNALSSINTTLPVDIKVVRLDGHLSKKPRPLKLIFKSKDEAANLLLKFRQSIRNGCNISNSLRLVWDKTFMERQLLRSAHAEFERRKQSGESNLVVKYVNGVPSVTKMQPKNDVAGRR
ncbi:Reverse transcriptase domain-containing protein [Aphis craccivora]|uniref:Reverse transcriptase domain-containing protein n=1 Tax=Aphis craccivora TaxID=307492 RepID=A0A6G0Y9J9_APHCR|nr:Reverse transcriptase domain-containing protein [Aphis craccivora]